MAALTGLPETGWGVVFRYLVDLYLL